MRPTPVRPPRPVPFAALALTAGLVLAGAVSSPAPLAGQAGGVDPALLAGLQARSIGPAAMSGRVVAVAGVPGNPPTLYVGAASSGLWKSADGGVTWEPLFDEQPVASIGAVAVDPTAPEVLWVGTGEADPRNSASVGDGVYRSMDGGLTWSHLGLERTEKIARVLLDPRDPEVAYVCALGTNWAETEERGVYKTSDGGRSWQRVLYVDPRTGCADLAMDPANPNKLLAALWEHRRWPWFFRSGGPGSGLYLTHDGGRTWRELTPEDGLPEPPLGRIGVAFAPSQPARVYALVEAEQNALYVSDDGGRSFTKASADENIGNRPFYYSQLRVDPADPNRIYSLWSLMSVSEDGGAGWRVLVPFSAVHPDHHDLWIDPTNPSFLVDGNDGGVAISYDRGRTWDFVRNLPFAQYYHVRVDDEQPYNVYGGLQDNGSWKGPSSVWENGGIRNLHWREVGFGDGFDTAPHPEDSMVGYAMSQQGYLSRWDLRTGERKDVRPAAPAAADGPEVELRFNWNAGFAQDPFEADTIYYGSQLVHRSTDRGETWEVISPDLTTDDPAWQRQADSGGLTPDVTGAENFTTILAIEPSPVERGVIWVGTDDGRLHVTRDGGGSWTSVEGNVRGVPENTWIPHLHSSRHDAGTAFAVFDNHRHFDWTPYAYRTSDYGATWTRLAAGGADGVRGYVLSILQDPVDPDLLFLGTEFGLWVSLDGGGSWLRWTHGVPTVSVMDLAFQEREADLVLGTHGRGVFVLDDVRPLRGLTAETLARPLHLFEIPDAVQHPVAQTPGSRFAGAGEFRGENRPYGAVVTFSLDREGLPHPDAPTERARRAEERRERLRAEEAAVAAAAETGESEAAIEEAPAAGEEEEEAEAGEPGRPGRPMAEIEVRDAAGEVVRTFERPVTLGINRVSWDLRRDPFRRPPSDAEESPWRRGGTEVPPGVYTVTVRQGGEEATGELRVLPDPRASLPEAEREARYREKYQAVLDAGALQERLSRAIERVMATRGDLERVRAKAKDEAPGSRRGEGRFAALRRTAGELERGLDELERELWTPPGTKGIPARDDPWSKVSYAMRALGSSWDAPTPAQLAYLEQARRAVDQATARAERFFAERVAPFRAEAEAAGLGLLAAEP